MSGRRGQTRLPMTPPSRCNRYLAEVRVRSMHGPRVFSRAGRFRGAGYAARMEGRSRLVADPRRRRLRRGRPSLGYLAGPPATTPVHDHEVAQAAPIVHSSDAIAVAAE